MSKRYDIWELPNSTTSHNLGTIKFSVLERTRFVCSFCEQLNLLENIGIKRPNCPTVGRTKIVTLLNPYKTPVARFYNFKDIILENWLFWTIITIEVRI